MELKHICYLWTSVEFHPFNRTKWNWNVFGSFFFFLSVTFNRTKWNWNCFLRPPSSRQTRLLIVLNGIETDIHAVRPNPVELLIVLNGIETPYPRADAVEQPSFNRTKWNWNFILTYSSGFCITFNRTKWNWNIVALVHYNKGNKLLIVLNGIETFQGISNILRFFFLLIVLNGIETWKDEQAREIQDLF